MLLLLQFSRSDSRLKEQKGEERRMRRREKRGGRRKEKMRIAGEKLSVVDIFHNVLDTNPLEILILVMLIL